MAVSLGDALFGRSQPLTLYILLQTCLQLLLDHLPLNLNSQGRQVRSLLSVASPACKALLHQMGKSLQVPSGMNTMILCGAFYLGAPLSLSMTNQDRLYNLS